ncbi:MAG: SH3 domain-containing protein, partial [Anaerolineae bacterium]|nr:SH3 domain-containing protein [Anaerolineae bacterium]
LQTQFSADDYYPMAIVTPGDSNNVRAEPSPSGELLGQIPAGGGMQIYREAPVCLNGNLWRHIATPQLEGWTVEASADTYFIVPYQQPDPVVFKNPHDGSDWVVSLRGVTFTVPAALPFDQISAQPEPFSLFTMYMLTSSLSFTFDQPLVDNWGWPTNITVYDYGNAPDLLSDGDWLQTLLTEQPPLVETFREQRRPPQSPIVGRSMYTGIPTYVPFGDGNGLRYITFFAAEIISFDPAHSSMVYRGMTDDGAYLIAMDMPVQLPSGAIPPGDPSRVPDANTINTFEDNLAARPTSTFTPDLALYDALFNSIQITNESALDAALP